MLTLVPRAYGPTHMEVIGKAAAFGVPVFRRDADEYDLVVPCDSPDGEIHFLGVREPRPQLVDGGAR